MIDSDVLCGLNRRSRFPMKCKSYVGRQGKRGLLIPYSFRRTKSYSPVVDHEISGGVRADRAEELVLIKNYSREYAFQIGVAGNVETPSFLKTQCQKREALQ